MISAITAIIEYIDTPMVIAVHVRYSWVAYNVYIYININIYIYKVRSLIHRTQLQLVVDLYVYYIDDG